MTPEQQTIVICLALIAFGLIAVLCEKMAQPRPKEEEPEQTGEFGKDHRLTGEQIALAELPLHVKNYLKKEEQES